MPYQESQASIGKWMDETFLGNDPESPRKSLRALEEMVELCLASGARYSDVVSTANKAVDAHIAKIPGGLGIPSNWYASRRDEVDPEKIPAEAADVAIVLFGLAHMRGFDLLAAVDDKMKTNRARKWNLNGDGTGYHKKESP